MIYVYAPNNVVSKYPYTLTDMQFDNPNTSFSSSITDELAAQFNTFPVVEMPQPQFNPITENLIWKNPNLIDGHWVQQWEVEPATPEQIAEREEAAKQDNKAQAENLLAESDWTDNPSVVDTSKALHLVNAAEWDAYRDSLRMIAVVPTVEVEWPIKPEEQWSV